MKQSPQNQPQQNIDPNDPNVSIRQQEGLLPNLDAQREGQPSAFAGMDTGTPFEGPLPNGGDETPKNINIAKKENYVPGEDS